jgi:predicted phosphoribosyltransferase
MDSRFVDRRDAGRVLARMLGGLASRRDLLVLALPRGGVPVGYEVARALGAPLDVWVVRKLGVPGQEELAMGAIAPGGVRVLNAEVISLLGIPDAAIERAAAVEERELERRMRVYRGDRPEREISGRTVILVDDSLATGSTMRAAVASLRQRAPAEIRVAVGTAAASTCAELAPLVDDLVCVLTPDLFHAVGLWYHDFSPTTDEEVRALLDAAEREQAAGAPLAH